MSHFESRKNVKKRQVVRFQTVRTFSYFARTRPSDFYFEKMALTEGKNELFVLIFQNVSTVSSQAIFTFGLSVRPATVGLAEQPITNPDIRDNSVTAGDGTTAIADPAATELRHRWPDG